MSLQVSTGSGSLLALGIAVSDVATLFGMARRVGNWLSASSGDKEFLELLDSDETDIFQRKGLIDILRFNKQWGSEITILANGRPTKFTGEAAKDHLDKFRRFTAIAVCLIAALEAFMSRDVAKSVLKSVLLELLQTTEWGEDVLTSHFPNRVNCWRSAADVRGLSAKARKIRLGLLKDDTILDGLMPVGDSKVMVEFLVWLLAGRTSVYVTPSTDVAGVGQCLAELGIDALSVAGLKGKHQSVLNDSCRLEYSPLASFNTNNSESSLVIDILRRVPCTTVSLESPRESLTKFPIDINTSNRCRQAWDAGRRAAEAVGWTPMHSSVWPDSWQYNLKFETTVGEMDVHYAFYDKGSKPSRVRTQIGTLVEAHGLITNSEIYEELENLLQRESDATLDWIREQTTKRNDAVQAIDHVNFHDSVKTNAFTIYEAFMMGYYYAVFLRLVDTSELQMKVVEGSWGYRSGNFLSAMHGYLSSSRHGIVVLRRKIVLDILSSLLCNTPLAKAGLVQKSQAKSTFFVGRVGKRTLLARSLLKPCRTAREIGQFVILDVDVSGIPRDRHGLVRPGLADDDFDGPSDKLPSPISTEKVTEDVSFHIEADWEGDPETILLCVRYRGRRIRTINPSASDNIFLCSTFSPAPKADPKPEVKCVELAALHCLNRQLLPVNKGNRPYLLQIQRMPRLCYAVASWYHRQGCQIRFAAGDVVSALHSGKQRNYIIVNGDVGLINEEDRVPLQIESRIKKAAKSLWSVENKSWSSKLDDAELN